MSSTRRKKLEKFSFFIKIKWNEKVTIKQKLLFFFLCSFGRAIITKKKKCKNKNFMILIAFNVNRVCLRSKRQGYNNIFWLTRYATNKVLVSQNRLKLFFFTSLDYSIHIIYVHWLVQYYSSSRIYFMCWEPEVKNISFTKVSRYRYHRSPWTQCAFNIQIIK